ncbi:hypothetical protein ACR2XN_28195 [Klebsiella pneumoniae]
MAEVPPSSGLSAERAVVSRYETIRVPILKPSEYPIWKVKMTMFLEATDPEYLDRIYEGPHKPTRLSVETAGQEAKLIPKEKKDRSKESYMGYDFTKRERYV